MFLHTTCRCLRNQREYSFGILVIFPSLISKMCKTHITQVSALSFSLEIIFTMFEIPKTTHILTKKNMYSISYIWKRKHILLFGKINTCQSGISIPLFGLLEHDVSFKSKRIKTDWKPLRMGVTRVDRASKVTKVNDLSGSLWSLNGLRDSFVQLENGNWEVRRGRLHKQLEAQC